MAGTPGRWKGIPEKRGGRKAQLLRVAEKVRKAWHRGDDGPRPCRRGKTSTERRSSISYDAEPCGRRSPFAGEANSVRNRAGGEKHGGADLPWDEVRLLEAGSHGTLKQPPSARWGDRSTTACECRRRAAALSAQGAGGHETLGPVRHRWREKMRPAGESAAGEQTVVANSVFFIHAGSRREGEAAGGQGPFGPFTA